MNEILDSHGLKYWTCISIVIDSNRVFLKNRHGKKLSSRCQVSKENGCVYLNSTVRMAFSGLKVKMNT